MAEIKQSTYEDVRKRYKEIISKFQTNKFINGRKVLIYDRFDNLNLANNTYTPNLPSNEILTEEYLLTLNNEVIRLNTELLTILNSTLRGKTERQEYQKMHYILCLIEKDIMEIFKVLQIQKIYDYTNKKVSSINFHNLYN